MERDFGFAAERELTENITVYLSGGTAVGPPGHILHIKWAPAAGAIAAEVTAAQVEITAVEVDEALGDLQMTLASNGAYAEISVPAGKRISALNLQGLKNAAGSLLAERADLAAAGLRLVTTLRPPGGSFGAPQFAVPPSPGRGMLPQMLTGASYTGGRLSFFPPVSAEKIRLSLATQSFPEEFDAQPMSLQKVSGVAAAVPVDLTMTDPSGGVAWAFPGEMLASLPTAVADLRMAVETAVEAALKSGAPLDFNFTLQASAAANAIIKFSGASGFLVREFPGIMKAHLEGEPQPLALDGPAPAAEMPESTVAGVTVRYLGMRILETVSDPMPVANMPIGGTVVRVLPVLRSFPPQAFTGLPVARIGLVGRAPEPTELVIQPVDLSTGPPGTPIGPPGVKKLEASADIHLEWVELPQPPSFGGPTGLAVHTTLGRFFWAGETQPLARIAVLDPDPGGRVLRLGGQSILAVDKSEINLPGFNLPTAVFNGAIPAWDSDLFLKVDLSDLALRYRR